MALPKRYFDHLGGKLPVSRWQRDLTDSTVLRNLGSGMAYSIIAYSSCNRGIQKLELDESRLAEDLVQNWEVLAEPIQTLMRKHGIPEPYEKLKALTRGRRLDASEISDLVAKLELPDHIKEQILAMTPADYTGDAVRLVDRLLRELS